ncbi:unnamed protein product [Gemmata massiliana]|uniref:Uncharacterized protein n=1 Tax=Gemmata massiliana TaxID=1210884 RepID=A0A6P2CWW1_9BACT|nr:unnamed protein product [Gemmata massiliana]
MPCDSVLGGGRESGLDPSTDFAFFSRTRNVAWKASSTSTGSASTWWQGAQHGVAVSRDQRAEGRTVAVPHEPGEPFLITLGPAGFRTGRLAQGADDLGKGRPGHGGTSVMGRLHFTCHGAGREARGMCDSSLYPHPRDSRMDVPGTLTENTYPSSGHRSRFSELWWVCEAGTRTAGAGANSRGTFTRLLSPWVPQVHCHVRLSWELFKDHLSGSHRSRR